MLFAVEVFPSTPLGFKFGDLMLSPVPCWSSARSQPLQQPEATERFPVGYLQSAGTMSWQSYVDDHLMCELPNGGQLQHAAIVGQDGGVWAQSENFPALTSDEACSTTCSYIAFSRGSGKSILLSEFVAV
jgi:hypothetical protein